MQQISLKLSEQTHQQLLLKKEELALDNISDVIRLLLRFALENHNTEIIKNHPNKLQKRALSYAIMSYCLLEESVLSLAEDGPILTEQAHSKAEKLINSLLQKIDNN